MSDCGCACGCASGGGSTIVAPAVLADPLRFRHAAIIARMLGRITPAEIDGERPLDSLGTRETDDPAIALIDAFAGSLHVLARNVGFLSDDGSIRRTADRDGLLEITRLLGYEPRPALAATTTLSFTVDEIKGAPARVRVPEGTKVASVPGQDETPQTFETDAELDARVELNALRPVVRLARPKITLKTEAIDIVGATTTAKVGDMVLVRSSSAKQEETWVLARIGGVDRRPNPLPAALLGLALPPRTEIGLVDQTYMPATPGLPEDFGTVILLGQRAAPFGAAAPHKAIVGRKPNADIPALTSANDWDFVFGPPGPTDLDAVYADAVPGRAILFTRPSTDLAVAPVIDLGTITSASEVARADYALSAKVTRLVVADIDFSLRPAGLVALEFAVDRSFRNKVRETAIYIETARESLLQLEEDYALPAPDKDRLVVRGIVEVPVGRTVVVTGTRWQADETLSEVATVRAAVADPASETTTLVFERDLTNQFVSTSLIVLGNCVAASNAESSVQGAEILASGDASKSGQRFALSRKPLAYLPASNPRGYAPAIEVEAAGRLYAAQPSIFGLPAEDRAYTIRQVRDRKSEVQFNGRLPTGALNVSALYRTGGGLAGNLGAGRLATIMTPVLGIRQAGNPVPAEGGSDAEAVDDLRSNAPRSVRALERAVSLSDFEAFARTYRGVGKAAATELRLGMRAIVCVTIANTKLESPAAGPGLIDELRQSLQQAAVPGRILRVEGFDELNAEVGIGLAVDPATHRRADIEAAVRAALADSFGRARRNFGEALTRSAVLAAVQSVPGVVAATIETFALPGGAPETAERLLAPVPRFDADATFHRGGLVSIAAAGVSFTEMPP